MAASVNGGDTAEEDALQGGWRLGISLPMIASYKCNFIFIKTRKTAGTSVELALGEHCGPDDIITPIGKFGVRRAFVHGV